MLTDKNHHPRNNTAKKLFAGKSKKELPPVAFMILDLTDKSLDARIIKITQIILTADGEQDLSEHYFNNEDRPISDEAFAHHGISAEFLKDKPKLSEFNFNIARNIAVWDGQVARILLKKNGITQTAPVLNLHSLARYLEIIPKPIRLNSYALKINPKKKHILEFQLKKSQNKIFTLPPILEHLKEQYLEIHGVNVPSFLFLVGKSRTKKGAMHAICQFLKNRRKKQGLKSRGLKGQHKGQYKGNDKGQYHSPFQNQYKSQKEVKLGAGIKAVIIKKRSK